jgi:hypothetical protein
VPSLVCVIIVFMATFDPIPLKPNISHEEPKNGEAVHRFRLFNLEPIGEVCLRFFLHIESAPDRTTVNMNRWQAGITQAGQPFVTDVTDYVTLEDNVLLLQIKQPGAFGAIWLEPTPCED